MKTHIVYAAVTIEAEDAFGPFAVARTVEAMLANGLAPLAVPGGVMRPTAVAATGDLDYLPHAIENGTRLP